MSRVFNASNARGAMVAEVESKAVLTHVMSVDIDAGEVRCAHQPVRRVGDQVDTYAVKYRTIYPIYGGGLTPALFHCYGRLA